MFIVFKWRITSSTFPRLRLQTGKRHSLLCLRYISTYCVIRVVFHFSVTLTQSHHY